MFRFEGRLEEIVMCLAGFMVTHLVMITAKAIVGSFVMTLLYSFLSISLNFSRACNDDCHITYVFMCTVEPLIA